MIGKFMKDNVEGKSSWIEDRIGARKVDELRQKGLHQPFFYYGFQTSAFLSMFHRMHCQDCFLPPYAVTGIRTHVSRVAPILDHLKDALPTELPRRG